MGAGILTGSESASDLQSHIVSILSHQTITASTRFATSDRAMQTTGMNPSQLDIHGGPLRGFRYGTLNWLTPATATTSGFDGPQPPFPETSSPSVLSLPVTSSEGFGHSNSRFGPTQSTTFPPLPSNTLTDQPSRPLPAVLTSILPNGAPTMSTSWIVSMSDNPNPATLESSQPSEALGHEKTGARSGVVELAVAIIIPCLILGTTGILLCVWWWRKKLKRVRQAETLEDTIVWCTENRPNIGGKGTGHRDTSTQEALSPDTCSPAPLPTEMTKRGHGMFNQQAGDLSPQGADGTPDPFTTPTTQLSPTSSNKSPGQDFRASQIGLAVTTSHNDHFSDSSSATSQSMHTVVHHAIGEFPDSSSESAALRHADTVQHDRPTSRGISPGETSKENRNGNGQELSDPFTDDSQVPEVDLARRFIRSLKREALEAQIAAAAAERQARGLRAQE